MSAEIKNITEVVEEDRLISLKLSLFNLLYEYEELELKYYEIPGNKKPLIKKSYLGIKRDDDYCRRSDTFFLKYPTGIFKDTIFATDYDKKSLTMIVLEEVGKNADIKINAGYENKEMPETIVLPI